MQNSLGKKSNYSLKPKKPNNESKISFDKKERIVNNYYNLIYDNNPKIEELKNLLIEKENTIQNLVKDKKNLQVEVKKLNQNIKIIEKRKIRFI